MYKLFLDWLFDGDLKRDLPSKQDLLKYNSPITVTYVSSLFLNNGKFNFFLNNYFNNIGLRYLDKEEFFKFIKKGVIDFKVQRRTIPFFKYQGRKTKLFDILRKRSPVLKENDISLLCDMFERSKDRDTIYATLGLDKPEQTKTKKEKSKKEKDNTTVKDFLKQNFTVVVIAKT